MPPDSASKPQTPSRHHVGPAWPRTALVALVFSALLLILHWYIYAPYTIDDAYICYRYAENLAAGDGLVYNVGERVEGYSNFLWIVLLACGSAVGIATPVCAKGLGLGLSLACLPLTVELARRLGLGAERVGAGAVVLLAASGISTASAVDGLETPLLTALILLGSVLYLREIEGRRGFPLSALVFLAAALTRPDGCVFFVVAMLHRLILFRRIKPHRWDLIMIALFVLPGLAYFLWRVGYYGQLMPNTFYAKGMATGDLLERGVVRFILFARNAGLWCFPLVIVHLLLGRMDHRRGLILALVGARLAFAIVSGGAWMGWEYNRLFLPVLPLLYLLAVDGLVSLVDRWRSGGEPKRRLLVVGGVAAAVVLNLWSSLVDLRPGRYAYALGLAQAHIALGRLLAESAPHGSTLACGDAGALPYYARLPTVDLLGLNDTHISHLPGGFYEKVDPRYVLGRQPTYVVVLSKEPDTFVPLTPVSALLWTQMEPMRDYRHTMTWMFSPTYHLWVYERTG